MKLFSDAEIMEIGYMNPLYDQLFNPRYANVDYLRQLQWKQYDAEQRQEIMNAVKAIHDYFDAARKIAPEYQQMAFDACITVVMTEMSKGLYGSLT